MSAANECIPFFEPGNRVTAKVTQSGGVAGCRLVAISGNRTSGPALATTAEGSVYQVAYPTLKTKVFGATSHDIAQNALGTIIRGSGMIVPIKNTGGVAANAEVQVKADGTVETLSDGVAVGLCVSGAADGVNAEIALYH